MHDDERDERWLTGLFDDHGRALLAYALRRVADPPDAADVVAETFSVAWRRRAEVPTGGEARLWLYGVGRRVLANHHRGERRRSHLADRLRAELAAQLPVTADHAPESATTHVVRAAVTRLPSDERELLWLTAWEGLEPTEIATVMRIPPGTVRSRLHRARQHLRDELLAGGWSPARRTHRPDEPVLTTRETDR